MRSEEHTARMDRIYRFERHLYDPLRKYFLFGRDLLLRGLEVRPGDRVLEVGCGTARNLIQLHRRHPEARLYGLDASDQMLRTARAKLARRGLTSKITLQQGLAEDLAPDEFGLDAPFDAVFFSYSLTMMPAWHEALTAAMSSLRPGGTLSIVDFWDQARLPWRFRTLLQAGLARYHVHFRPEVLDHLHQLAVDGAIELELEPILRRYAYYAILRLKPNPPGE